MTPFPLSEPLTLLGYTVVLAFAVVVALATLIGALEWSVFRSRERRCIGDGRPRL